MESKILLCILVVFVLTFPSVKSQGFTCKSTTVSECTSLAGYVLPNPTTLSSIANLFGLKDFNLFLGANSLPFGTSPNKSVAAMETIKIPFNCSCQNGFGISDKTPVYRIKAGDGLDHIARDIYSSLVTYEDIISANNIPDPTAVDFGQSLLIPLPCSCDDVDGKQVVHYAHKVSPKETIEMIAKEFGVTEETLLTLNDLDDVADLKAESVLDVPLKVCTSMVNNTSPDYPLLVSNGTYIFTANNCVRCTCNSNENWTLRCESSPPDIKVRNWKQCPSNGCVRSGINYELGSSSPESNCMNRTCSYTGYNIQSKTIYASMINTLKCREPGRSPQAPPSGLYPSLSGSPNYLQGWNILRPTMSLGFLIFNFLLS